MVDLAGGGDLYIAAVRFRPCTDRRVECRGGVKQFLHVMDGILVLQRAEKPKVQLQEAKGLLPDVQLHRIILDILLLDHGPVVKDADRGPVMAVLRTSAKGDVSLTEKS